MDFNQYKKLALRTESQPRLSRIQHALMWMSTEVAEMMDNLKKHMFYNKELDIANLKEEMWDVMRYMDILSDAINIPLEDVLKANIAKLKVRYPD